MTERTGSAAEELDEHMDSQQGNGSQGKRRAKPRSVVIAVALIAVVVVAAIAGCSAEKTQTVTMDWLSVKVPEEWTVEYGDGNWPSAGITPDDFDGYMSIFEAREIEDYESDIELQKDFANLIADNSDDDYEITFETFEIDDAVVLRITYDCVGVDESEENSVHEVGDIAFYQYVYSGNEYIWIYCTCNEDTADEMETVLDSMTLENPSAPA